MWKEQAIQFVSYLSYEKNASQYKINDYTKKITYMARYLPFPFSLNESRAFLVHLKKKKVSPAYINYWITLINCLITWALLEKKPFDDFREDLNKLRPKEDRTPDANDLLSQEEVRKLITTPPDRPIQSKKLLSYYARVDEMYNLMFELIYRCFCRSGEVLKLQKKHFNFSHHSMTFYDTKTSDNRVVGIPPMLEERLQTYMNDLTDNNYLFCKNANASKNTPINQEMANKTFKQRGKWLNLNRPLHIHMLRHSGATHYLNSGAPMRTVQVIGGWKRLSTVELYTHIMVDDQRSLMTKYDPLESAISDKKLLFNKVKSLLEELHLEKTGAVPIFSFTPNKQISLTITI